MAGDYGMSAWERAVTSRLVHRYTLASGIDKFIIAEQVDEDEYVAPLYRSNRMRLTVSNYAFIRGTLNYLYGSAPDFGRKYDAMKAVHKYYDLEKMGKKLNIKHEEYADE